MKSSTFSFPNPLIWKTWITWIFSRSEVSVVASYFQSFHHVLLSELQRHNRCIQVSCFKIFYFLAIAQPILLRSMGEWFSSCLENKKNMCKTCASMRCVSLQMFPTAEMNKWQIIILALYYWVVSYQFHLLIWIRMHFAFLCTQTKLFIIITS